MAHTASAAVIAAVCPSSSTRRKRAPPVGGQEEHAAGDHTGGGARQPHPEPVHADHGEQAGGARDEEPERRARRRPTSASTLVPSTGSGFHDGPPTVARSRCPTSRPQTSHAHTS